MALLALRGRNPYHYRFYMAGINIIMSQVVSNKITPWAILRNICEDHIRSWNQKWGWGPYNLGSQDWPCSLLILNCGPCSAMSWLTLVFPFTPKRKIVKGYFDVMHGIWQTSGTQQWHAYDGTQQWHAYDLQCSWLLGQFVICTEDLQSSLTFNLVTYNPMSTQKPTSVLISWSAMTYLIKNAWFHY